MTYTNFCDRFSAMRKERNLSQNTLAKELNVTRKTVGDWESSRSSSVCMITLSLYSLNFEMSMLLQILFRHLSNHSYLNHNLYPLILYMAVHLHNTVPLMNTPLK